MTEHPRICPHCNKPLSKWATPEMTSWGGELHYVCFNDDCEYFKKGWAWMQEKYAHNSSYRFRLDPHTGNQGPLPVWSADALKDGIVEEE